MLATCPFVLSLKLGFSSHPKTSWLVTGDLRLGRSANPETWISGHERRGRGRGRRLGSASRRLRFESARPRGELAETPALRSGRGRQARQLGGTPVSLDLGDISQVSMLACFAPQLVAMLGLTAAYEVDRRDQDYAKGNDHGDDGKGGLGLLPSTRATRSPPGHAPDLDAAAPRGLTPGKVTDEPCATSAANTRSPRRSSTSGAIGCSRAARWRWRHHATRAVTHATPR